MCARRNKLLELRGIRVEGGDLLYLARPSGGEGNWVLSYSR